MAKQNQLLKNLEAGKEYTPKQITATFGIAHPASAVRHLREQGNCIYANKATLADGTETTKYRLGKPSKRMVAAANRVLGAQAFSY